MKKLLLVFLTSFLAVFAFSQFPNYQQFGSPTTLTDFKGASRGIKGIVVGRYADTATANLGYIKYYPGAHIVTDNPRDVVWLRNYNATAWLFSGGSGSGSITNIFNNSTTNISIINDTTIQICTGAGSCDTFHINNTINNISTVGFIDSSHIVVCAVVGVTPDSSTSVCDTFSIPAQKLYVFQSGVGEPSAGIVELGDVYGQNLHGLLHDTRINTNARFLYQGNLYTTDNTVSHSGFLGGYVTWTQGSYNYSQQQPFIYKRGVPAIGAGTGYSNGQGFTIDNDTLSYTVYPFPDSTGPNAYYPLDIYWTNHNGVSNEKFKVRADGSPWMKNLDYVAAPDTIIGWKDGFAVATLRSQLGGSVVNVFNDTTIIICSVISASQSTACDTFIVNNVGAIQTVTISGDTLFVCGVSLCDTLITNTTFSTAALVIQNSLYVTKNGNDATGVRNRIDKPYLNIRAAIAAAQKNDVVVVFPGIYETDRPIRIKDSVNFQFIGTGEVRLVTSIASGAVITDSSTAVSSIIQMDGWAITARSDQTAIKQSAASNLKFTVDQITSNTSPVLDCFSGTINIKANRTYTANSFATLYIEDANCTFDISVVEAGINGNALYIEDCPTFFLNAKKIFCDPTNGDYLVYMPASNAGDKVYINADEIKSGTEWAVYFNGSDTVAFVEAGKITGNTDCIVVSHIPLMNVTADIIESTNTTHTDGIIHGEGGLLRVRNATLVRTVTASGYDVLSSLTGGKVQMIGVTYDINRVNELNGNGNVKRIDTLWKGANVLHTDSRLEYDTAQIVAANNLVLGKANVNLVSGNTQITAIDTTQWQSGSPAILIFSGTPTVKNNTAGGANTIPLKLAGGVDFTAAAGDVLTVVRDVSFWRETARTLASTGPFTGITADNANTASTSTNIQWGSTTTSGSPLLHNTYVNNAGFFAEFQQSSGNNTLLAVVNSTAASSSINSAFYVDTKTTSNLAASAYITNSADGGTALYAIGQGAGSASGGLAGRFATDNITNNSIPVPVVSIERGIGGGINLGANGVGAILQFKVETSTLGLNNAGAISNQIKSIWTDYTTATRTSQFIIAGVNNAVTGDIISFEGNKRTMLYGRLEMQQGVDVASVAGAIAVGLDGNTFELTGTNAVTLISNLNWVNGSEITFVFTSTATLTDGTANSGTDIGMELAGNANFVGSADDVITLVLSEIGGTQRWREKSRSVN